MVRNMVMNKLKKVTLQALAWGTLLTIIPLNVAAMSWKDWWLTPDQQASHALSQKQPQKAAQLFNRHDWRAIANYHIAAYQAALDEWDRALAQIKTSSNSIATPKNIMSLSEIYYNRGNVLAHLERYQEAIVSYEKSLSFDPNNDDATFNLALIKQLLKQQKNLSSSSSDNTQSPPTDNNSSDKNTSNIQPKNNPPTQKPTTAKDSNNQLSNRDNSNQPQSLQQWLNKVPDDPGGLLKQKFLRDEKRDELQQFLDQLGETRV
jgi:Ca-activated chloride channel family protein